MQQDVYSLPGRQAAAVLATVEVKDDWERKLLAEAAAWDGNLTVDSVGGCVCMVFQHHLLRAIFGSVLGDLTELYLGNGLPELMPRPSFSSRAVPLVYDLVRARDDGWFARMGVPARTWDTVLREALTASAIFLRERLRAHQKAWRWGRLNALRFNHALGQRSPLDRYFHRGPLPMGGEP